MKVEYILRNRKLTINLRVLQFLSENCNENSRVD